MLSSRSFRMLLGCSTLNILVQDSLLQVAVSGRLFWIFTFNRLHA